MLALHLSTAADTFAVIGWRACTTPGAVLPSSGPLNESAAFTAAAIDADPRLQVTGTLVVEPAGDGGLGCIVLDTGMAKYLVHFPAITHGDPAGVAAVVLPDGRSFAAGARLQLDGALRSSPSTYLYTPLMMSSQCGSDTNIVRPLRITQVG